MAQTQITLSLKPKWWLMPAVFGGALALRLGLIKEAPSAEHISGVISPDERVAKWLADFAFTWGID